MTYLENDMNEFYTFHPTVNFIYFLLTITYSMVLMHPVCLAVSLLCAVVHAALLSEKKVTGLRLVWLIPVFLFAAVTNPLFNHAGVTILAYFPDGNPLTLESCLYGVAAAAMLCAVITHFYCFGRILTGDKLMYLFGRIIPSLSLIFSMILRLIPMLRLRLSAIVSGQKALGTDTKNSSLLTRTRHGLRTLSILLTWTLESAIDTADSMKSRGYGLSHRTAFSIYKFSRRDFILLLFFIGAGGYILTGLFSGAFSYSYYPGISTLSLSPYSVSLYVIYFLLCATPILIVCWEERKWH